MIIKQLNITHVSVLKPKNDPPIGADGDSPESLSVAFEGMQAIAGKIKSLRSARGVERSQNIFDLVDEISSDLAAVATFVTSFQPLMLETYDHIT
jgi:hypothetical protein